MKIRKGFVSNSSSTSFCIINHSNNDLTLVEFILENPNIVEDFNREYGCDYTQEQMLQCAVNRNQIFNSGKNYVTYGDEDGDVLGKVFDYVLRHYGQSKSFTWAFLEYNR